VGDPLLSFDGDSDEDPRMSVRTRRRPERKARFRTGRPRCGSLRQPRPARRADNVGLHLNGQRLKGGWWDAYFDARDLISEALQHGDGVALRATFPLAD